MEIIDEHIRRARAFMGQYRRGMVPDLASVDILAEAALDEQQALTALYGIIVEGLCDDFSIRGQQLCARVLLRILAVARRQPLCRELDRRLSLQGFRRPSDFLRRYAAICRPGFSIPSEPRLIFYLSRVRIGADVVIGSVILQRLRRRFPAAEIVAIGPRHLQQIFGSLAGVRFRFLEYERRGALLHRIRQCFETWEVIHQEQSMAGCDALLVDPDSRLSQLGLQPFVDATHTWYLPSRSLGGENDSLITITNRWLNRGLAESTHVWPRLFVSDRCRRLADLFHRRLGGRRLLVVNFGVGGNRAKRLADPFEERVILRLLQDPERVVLLDSGKSPAGRQRVERILTRTAGQGFACSFRTAADLAGEAPTPLIGFRSDIGELAAVLAEADGFVGYDSCCQHLAAAAGVPGVVLFAGAPHRRFIARWRPRNRSDSLRIITIDDGREIDLQKTAKLVEDVASFFDQLPCGPLQL